MRRARTDHDRLRRIDAVSSREGEWETWQRRATPADRRATRVRAERPSIVPETEGRTSATASSSSALDPSGLQSKTMGRGCLSAGAWEPRGCGRSDEDARGAGMLRSDIRTRSTDAKPSSSAGGSSSRNARICCVGVSAPAIDRGAASSSSEVGSAPNCSSRRSTRFTCACASVISTQTQRTGTPWRVAASTT
ncbi:MAG: hypothetical protein K0S64_1537 [Gaiellaceae bacterium]|jgi:hypothetical protein|nr:hypothetical protein [Gaiellaceae bacterium]